MGIIDLVSCKSIFVGDSKWLWLGVTGDSCATILLVMPPKTTGVYMLCSSGLPNFHVSSVKKPLAFQSSALCLELRSKHQDLGMANHLM